MLDADTWISRRHFAAESPVRGRSTVVQEPSLGEQKGANAYRSNPSYFCGHFLEPSGERRVTRCSRAKATNHEDRIASTLELAEVVLSHERQHAALALHGQPVGICDYLNYVNGATREAIHRVEDLERADQVEFIHWRYYDHDNRAARGLTARTGVLRWVDGHAFRYYAAS